MKLFKQNSMLAKVLTPRRLIIIGINVFLLTAFIVCITVANNLQAPLHSQQAARVWAGQSGERFAQVSAFIPKSAEFTMDNIHRIRASIDEALLGISLESTPENRLYTDAWSAEAEFIVVGERGATPAPVSAIGVGGDFFIFNPLRLRDGSYITPNDFMRDRVILDEELAWQLFGGVQLAGLEVTINDRPFVIAGVVVRENDFASRRTYTYGPGFFMSYEALAAMDDEYDGTIISTYQIVMPDPITRFAENALVEAINNESIHVVANTSRFALENSFGAIRSFGERSIWNSEVSYPYWENAARFVEDWLALLLVLSLAFIVFPVYCFVFYSVKAIRFAVRRGKQKVKVLVETHDKHEYEKYVGEHQHEPSIYNIDEIIREVKNN